ncbi:MAG: glycosyltransferase family 9 protein [Candidatus Desulfofervidaceae bacterium]|nr:glycosyltransferase family 9 protein [Candidatus Desulfofervidaceae bacterium]
METSEAGFRERMKEESWRKILLVRNDNIGDVLCTTPCFEILRKHFPDAYIALLVCSLTYEVVEGNPFLDKIFVYEKAKHAKSPRILAWLAQWRVLKEIRREKFDLAINLRPDFSPSAARIVWASGARYRLGTQPVLKKHQKWKFFYDIFIPYPSQALQHEVDRTCFLLSPLGVSLEEISKNLYFAIPTELLSQAQKFFASHSLPLHKAICLHLGGRKEANRFWRISNWAKLYQMLKKAGYSAFFTYTFSDRGDFQDLCHILNEIPPNFCSHSLKAFGAILKYAGLFIGVDGGAMHIAASLKVPCVIIFSKTSITRWHPWHVPQLCLQAEDKNVNSILPEKVAKAVKQLL